MHLSQNILDNAIDLVEDNPAEAQKLVEEILDNPGLDMETQIRCYQLMASVARYENDYPQANEWLSKAESLLAQHNNGELLFYQHLEAAQLASRFNFISDAEKNYELATEIIRKYPEMAPFGTAAKAMWADLKIGLQDFEAAYELINQAIETEKSQEHSILLSMLETKLADLFLYLDLPEKAMAILESAQQHAQPDDRATLFRARIDLALDLDDHTQLTELTAIFESDSIYKDFPDLTYTVIAAYIRIGAYKKAEAYLERLHTFYKETGQEINLFYLFTVAIELYKGTKEYEKGRAYFAKAQKSFPHDLQPSYSWILYQSYAELLWEEGSTLEALDAFQMAVEFLEYYRKRVPDEPNRLRFYSDKYHYLNDYISIGLRAGQLERALNWLEASKSLTLLDHVYSDELNLSFQFQEVSELLSQPSTLMKKALLEFFHSEEYLYAFLLRPDKEEKLTVYKLPISINEIQQAIKEIREAIEMLTRDDRIIELEIINQISLPLFESLGPRIFPEELQKAMADLEGIYLVPYEHLHYLPIHALSFGEGILIDQMAVAYLPAASLLSYVSSPGTIKQNESKFLGIGVDAMGDYSAFSKEIQRIEKMGLWPFNQFVSLRNEQAIKPSVLEELPHADVIHFSTHGYFSEQDSLESGILLYTEEEEFNVPEQEGSDLILSAYELREQHLKAELVVMSACVTGQSENHPGDELLGLSRALLFAGAKSMILTLFASFKGVTAHPETHFGNFYQFWLQHKQPKALAFRNYIKHIKEHPLFSHPLFWIPYIYIGSLD